jgi:hypothetical protein
MHDTLSHELAQGFEHLCVPTTAGILQCTHLEHLQDENFQQNGGSLLHHRTRRSVISSKQTLASYMSLSRAFSQFVISGALLRLVDHFPFRSREILEAETYGADCSFPAESLFRNHRVHSDHNRLFHRRLSP